MAVRLFAALVPPVPVLAHAERALETVRSGAAAALRWVPRENLHVTLAFYGDVPEGAVSDLVAGLAVLAQHGAAVRALSVYRGPEWRPEACRHAAKMTHEIVSRTGESGTA